MDFFDNVGLVLKQVNPSEFTIIIYKAHIIFISPIRFRCRPPTARENKFKGIARSASGLWIWLLMAFGPLTRTTNTIFIHLELIWKIKISKNSLNNLE
jgi:hypothetical protein